MCLSELKQAFFLLYYNYYIFIIYFVLKPCKYNLQYSIVPLGGAYPHLRSTVSSRLCPNPLPSPQEVFYLTYTSDDIEGNMHLDTGDKVSFYMETNKQ